MVLMVEVLMVVVFEDKYHSFSKVLVVVVESKGVGKLML